MTNTGNPSTSRALQVITNLQQNLEQARKENRYLRRRVEGLHPYHYNTAPRILRRAYDDSIAILVLRAGGYNIGRGFCYELGISERRYFWAVGLLRSSRVMRARGNGWLVDDFATAESRVNHEYARIGGQSNGLEMLRLYMPRKMARTYISRRNV